MTNRGITYMVYRYMVHIWYMVYMVYGIHIRYIGTNMYGAYIGIWYIGIRAYVHSAGFHLITCQISEWMFPESTKSTSL